MPGATLTERLWRVRKRHDHLDATLVRTGGEWVLRYWRNDRLLLSWRFAVREQALREASSRLRDLQRAGWTTHW